VSSGKTCGRKSPCAHAQGYEYQIATVKLQGSQRTTPVVPGPSRDSNLRVVRLGKRIADELRAKKILVFQDAHHTGDDDGSIKWV
jgi:hypothetical protein